MTEKTMSEKRRRSSRVLHLCACAIVLCLQGEARELEKEGALPEASAILDRYVEATGGKQAYDAIENCVVEERLVHVGREVEDTAITYAALPDKRFTEIRSEFLGDVLSGCDGETVWYLSDMVGAVVQEGAAKSAGLHAAAFLWPARWRALYEEVECTGKALVEGRSCYRLRMTTVAGQEETRYFDEESGLLLKTETTRLFSGLPPMPMEVLFGDYRRVDGLLVAHELRQLTEQCGARIEMRILKTRVRHNVELAEDRFAPPEEIREVAGHPSLPAGGGGCGGSGDASSSGR
jgi:hypothetical protein